MENLDIIEYKRFLRKIQNELKSTINNSSFVIDNKLDLDIYKQLAISLKLFTLNHIVLDFGFILFSYIYSNSPFFTLPGFLFLTISLKNYILRNGKIKGIKTTLLNIKENSENNEQALERIKKIEEVIQFLNRLTDEDILLLQEDIIKKGYEIYSEDVIKYLENLKEEEKTKYLGYKM